MAALIPQGDGHRLVGHEVTLAGGLRFEILVDEAWRTRAVDTDGLVIDYEDFTTRIGSHGCGV